MFADATEALEFVVSENVQMVDLKTVDLLGRRRHVTLPASHLTEESLTSLEEEFGPRFVRIHRNTLVARKSIRGFERVRGQASGEGEGGEGHWEVLLKDLADRLPISRRQWPVVKQTALS